MRQYSKVEGCPTGFFLRSAVDMSVFLDDPPVFPPRAEMTVSPTLRGLSDDGTLILFGLGDFSPALGRLSRRALHPLPFVFHILSESVRFLCPILFTTIVPVPLRRSSRLADTRTIFSVFVDAI